MKLKLIWKERKGSIPINTDNSILSISQYVRIWECEFTCRPWDISSRDFTLMKRTNYNYGLKFIVKLIINSKVEYSSCQLIWLTDANAFFFTKNQSFQRKRKLASTMLTRVRNQEVLFCSRGRHLISATGTSISVTVIILRSANEVAGR